MKFSRHTPLAQAGFNEEQRLSLESLWIESIEEAVAAAAAADGNEPVLEKSGLNVLTASPALVNSVSPERLSALQTAHRGGILGCLLDASFLESYRAMGRLRPTRAIPSGAFTEELPDAVRLMDQLAPVGDQGNRGTCVAFSVAALREFLAGGSHNFSEQFLYWACKELDGHPGPGTFMHTAMSALAQYGICLESAWPYNPNQTSTEGQGPPPPGACENAVSYRLESTRTVEPNLVLHYKKILAGESGRNGMPISFGTLVFNSWYMSAESNRTGKITLPLPGEPPVGGHAWCVVGYVDDASIPGGGCFIVRNSWGMHWASDSPEAAGHGLMPYAYVEAFAFDAFTGPVSSTTSVMDRPTQHRRTLEQDTREALGEQPKRGRLLKAGTRVLADRMHPEVFYEATPANEALFLRRDCTWTEDSRQQLWFSPPDTFPETTQMILDKTRADRIKFTGAVNQNLMASKGTPFPFITPPWWLKCLSFVWEPKISSVSEVGDLSRVLMPVLRKAAGTPEGLVWLESWNGLLAGLNEVNIYALEWSSHTIHVVSAFLAPLKVQKHAVPAIAPLDHSLTDAVYQAYMKWLKKNDLHRPDATFVSYGCRYYRQTEEFSPSTEDYGMLISFPDNKGNWKTITPRRVGDDPGMQHFVDRLKPETEPERVCRIKECVDALIPEGGNVTVERVSEATGYRALVIRQAFFMLQNQYNNKYRVYKTTKGESAVKRP